MFKRGIKTAEIGCGLFLIILFAAAGCNPRFYRPPALGAEYQINRGLPREKKPDHLFNKKVEKDLTEKGVLHDQRFEKNSRKKSTTNPKKRTVSNNPPTEGTPKSDSSRNTHPDTTGHQTAPPL